MIEQAIMRVPVSAAVRQLSGRWFPPETAAAACRLLAEADLPLINNDGERVHVAILLLAKGDFKKFQLELNLALRDWRDVLVAAGLANEDWPEVLRSRGIRLSQH